MALETNRKMSVRRITAPGDDSTYVDLKVIDSIMFVDPKQHYQEWELSFENNLDAARKSHVVEVGEDKLKVERIDALNSIHNAGGRWQEWSTEYENGEQTPVHYRTHKRKIYHRNKDGTKDTSIWIEVQRIDAIWFTDPKEHYQERVWELVWPDNEDEEWDYQGLTEPVKDWDKTSINPPWRLDPFQTIVDCSLGAKYMLVFYGGNKIAAVSMSNITKAAFPLAFNKTLTSSWDSYGADTVTCQLRFGPKAHILGMNLKIDADGTVSTPAQYSQVYYYNTAYSLLQSATYTGDFRFDNFFNGTDKVFYTCLGRRYSIDQNSGAVSSDGVQLTVDYIYPTAVSDTGQYYSGARVNAYLQDINMGGFVTFAQSTAIFENLASSGTYNIGYSYASGPGASQVDVTKVSLSSNTEPWSWSGGGSVTFPRMIYSNDGKVDKVTLKFETATYSTDGFKDTTLIDGPAWGSQYANSTLSFLGLNGSYSVSQASGPYPGPPPDAVFSTSGVKKIYNYNSLTGFALGEAIEDMWIDIRSFSGGTDETRETRMPYGVITVNAPEDERYEDSFVCNGKHYLSVVRQGEFETSQQFFYLDRVDVTSKFQALIGGSGVFVDHIVFDVKLSDIKKLK